MCNTTRVEELLPQLTFFLRLIHKEPWVFCQNGENGKRRDEMLHQEGEIEQEIARVFGSVDLDHLEVIYLYGIGLGHYIRALVPWLAKDVKRDLVVIEDDIEVLRLFLNTEGADKLIEHPQIHIRFMLDPKRWKQFLEERALEFPYEKSELIALEHYRSKRPRRVLAMRLYLLRRVTVHDAMHKDDLYYPVLSKNVLLNFPRIQTAFYANRLSCEFQGVPAVVCGAGPSLQDEKKVLCDLEDRALLFAGGSAISGLGYMHVLPHFCVAVDPNFEEVSRFKKSCAFEVPLLYTNRLHPAVFNTFNGPHGYIHARTGGPLEAWWENEMGIEPLPLQGGFDIEALSVTTVCLELATTMGCNPIYLVGVDLAFTNNMRYTEGVIEGDPKCLLGLDQKVRASERPMLRKDRHGRCVRTLVKWIMESQTIGRFIKNNPKTHYINSTSGGIGIPGMPYQKLSRITFRKAGDLRGKIHQLIEMNRFAPKVTDPLKKIVNSLREGLKVTHRALDELARLKGRDQEMENGRLILFQMELESLLAYSLCLEKPSHTFRKTFERVHRLSSSVWTPRDKWDWLYAKWNGFYTLITNYLDILHYRSDPIS